MSRRKRRAIHTLNLRRGRFRRSHRRRFGVHSAFGCAPMRMHVLYYPHLQQRQVAGMMTSRTKFWTLGACLALLACGVVILSSRQRLVRPWVATGELSGKLSSQKETFVARDRLSPSGAPEIDAQSVLQALERQSQAVSSFRVRQTRHYMGANASSPPIRSLIVGARPNQLVMRYENWAGALAFAADGTRFRLCNETDLDAGRPEDQKRFVSGTGPDSFDSFLRYASQLSTAPPTHAYPEIELMAVLPFTDNLAEFLSSRGWGTVKWLETVELDGQLTEHLECSGRVCRQKAAASARNSESSNPSDSDLDLEPEESKLHLWIDAEGPALLRKASLGDFAMTYTDWVLDPHLPDHTFELPNDLGYEEIAFDFPEGGSMLGRPAPELALTSLNGQRFQLSDLQGSVVVLDFWATWCGPCMRELPIVAEIVEEFSEQGVRLLAVTNETDIAKIKATLTKLNVNVEAAVDHDDKSSAFGVVAIPHLVVIDRRGDIRAVHIGLTSGLEEDLRKELGVLAEQ